MAEPRRMLVHVSDSARSAALLRVACRLAASHGAALTAMHTLDPLILRAYLSAESALSAAALSQDEEKRRRSAARAMVEAASLAGAAPIGFESLTGDPVDLLAAASRLSDLLIAGQPDDADLQGPPPRFASLLLMASGCPVLFVPSVGAPESCGSRVLVAWSDTRESARALRDALPLLRRASSVEVLRVAAGEATLDPVLDYLKAQDVAATGHVAAIREMSFAERMLTPTVVDASVAELLLSHAADMNADLLVMGGYGHTRTHELLLGGATRTMLESMTVPVLMSR